MSFMRDLKFRSDIILRKDNRRSLPALLYRLCTLQTVDPMLVYRLLVPDVRL